MESINNFVEYWHWIIFGITLCVVEIFAPSFFFLLIGISAIVIGILLSVFEMTFNEQLALWIALSISSLVIWFKYLNPRIATRSLSGMALEQLIGEGATVAEYNPETRQGKIKFAIPMLGEDSWDAVFTEDASPGDRVTVVDIVGNKLQVRNNRSN